MAITPGTMTGIMIPCTITMSPLENGRDIMRDFARNTGKDMKSSGKHPIKNSGREASKGGVNVKAGEGREVEKDGAETVAETADSDRRSIADKREL